MALPVPGDPVAARRAGSQATKAAQVVRPRRDRNVHVAKRFHAMFPRSELFLLPTARHYVQVDEPEEVARLILSMPN